MDLLLRRRHLGVLGLHLLGLLLGLGLLGLRGFLRLLGLFQDLLLIKRTRVVVVLAFKCRKMEEESHLIPWPSSEQGLLPQRQLRQAPQAENLHCLKEYREEKRKREERTKEKKGKEKKEKEEEM